ncbi:hypothetical protein [Streptomyces sp. NPDC048428]
MHLSLHDAPAAQWALVRRTARETPLVLALAEAAAEKDGEPAVP